MNEVQKKILSLDHPNKEFLEKFRKLFTEMFEKENQITKEYSEKYDQFHLELTKKGGEVDDELYAKYKDVMGLDAPMLSKIRDIRIEYFTRFKQLKKEYGIEK